LYRGGKDECDLSIKQNKNQVVTDIIKRLRLKNGWMDRQNEIYSLRQEWMILKWNPYSAARCRLLQCAAHETLLSRNLGAYADVLTFTAIMIPPFQLLMFSYGAVTSNLVLKYA
jgi:hypothetical protein